MTMRRTIICFLAAFAPLAAQAKNATLYDRVAAHLARDSALAKQLGKPAAEMASVAWMLGTWDIATTIDADPSRKPDKGKSVVSPVLGGVWLEIRDTYPQGNQDISYLTFNPATKSWTSTTVDGIANAVTSTAQRWDGNKLVFTGDVVVVGEKAVLRQTITKLGGRAYTVTNEERMPDGKWRLLDTYRYSKR